MLKESVIWQLWDETVGPQIARRAKPAAIRNGILTVTVSSSPWLQQLNYMKAELCVKINNAIGEEMVKEIYLKAGSLKETGTTPAASVKKSARRLSPDEETRIAGITAELDDPELRESFSTLFSTHLSHNPESER